MYKVLISFELTNKMNSTLTKMVNFTTNGTGDINPKNNSSQLNCVFSTDADYIAFVATLVINSGAMIMGIIGSIIVAAIDSLDIAVRSILLSFNIANIAGAIIFIYQTIMTICLSGEASKNGRLVNISVLLTVTHLIMLVVVEHIIVSTSKRAVEAFTGLIVVFWIISISLGLIIAITDEFAARFAFIIALLIIIFILIFLYAYIVKKTKKRKKVRETYEDVYLSTEKRKSALRERFWKLQYFGVILISFIVFAFPWILSELFAALSSHDDEVLNKLINNIDAFSLQVMSIHFYFPSGICLHVWYKTYKTLRIRPQPP